MPVLLFLSLDDGRENPDLTVDQKSFLVSLLPDDLETYSRQLVSGSLVNSSPFPYYGQIPGSRSVTTYLLRMLNLSTGCITQVKISIHVVLSEYLTALQAVKKI